MHVPATLFQFQIEVWNSVSCELRYNINSDPQRWIENTLIHFVHVCDCLSLVTLCRFSEHAAASELAESAEEKERDDSEESPSQRETPPPTKKKKKATKVKRVKK